ncbi:Type I Iterative PKS [Diaporthe australafricana]|uniref:Type I Iterative PKS n=1 Tax=Diaporthe australafricana TaxID=127596 RepID=A0ABR3Y554_9PEZI
MASTPTTSKNAEPIAIVGMGCRWPGSVRDAPGLWELLKNKRSGYKEFSEPRFSVDGFYHPDQGRPGTMSTKGGFLLDEDPRLFDPTFFGMTGLETETMDASQRKLLEVIYEAFENSGETWESVSGSRTGVFVGNFSLDHWVTQARDWDHPRPYATTGASTSILSNRISYIFNLQGPSLAIDTACSSSMYAIHLAVSAIRNGDCDSAVVAASNWIMDPSLQMALDKLGALSPTSTCHTFDASADGYARGEGFAAIYLKKTDLAVEDGSPIRAVIRGTAVNANGRTGGITRPSAIGQEAVIRKAYDNAGGLPLDQTTYFEIHGTGTPAGDPIEVSAVGNVFSSVRSDSPDDRLLIGSVKTNLGHTEGGSALAALMKLVLSLEVGFIPPSIGISTLNPSIDFEKAKVEVVRDVIPWPEGKLKRASINSFGFGGANGHCIVDHVNNVLPNYVKPGVINRLVQNGHETGNGHITNGNGHTSNGHTANGLNPSKQHGNKGPRHLPITNHSKLVKRADAKTRQLILLLFSGHNEPSLKLNINALSLVTNQHCLADIAYTLASKRSRLSHRTFRVVDKDSVTEGLETSQRVFQSPLEPARLGFVFTGQGSQWHAMGAELFEYRAFRIAIEYLDFVLSTLPARPSWTLVGILSGECDKEFIQTAEVSQTACTAVQIGLVDLLASWSVRPSGVVGHSSGEMAAAYAGGHITAAEAIVAAYFRGQAVSKNTAKGAMVAVGLDPEQAFEYLKGQEETIRIAAVNSPDSVTLSGDAAAVQRLAETLTQAGVFNRLLRTGGNAYHSHHMLALGRDYSTTLSAGLAHVADLGLSDDRLRYPAVPWTSSTTPNKRISLLDVKASYWRANLQSPVRFSEAVSKLLSSEDARINMFVEIGPHPSLKSPLDQIMKSVGRSIPYASSLKRNEDGRASLLGLAGNLFSLNAEINLVSVNAVDDVQGGELVLAHGCTAVDLPPYQYNYGPVVYHESRPSKEYRLRNTIRHDLIGSRIPGNAKLRPQWRNILRLKDLPWLSDHRLLPDPVFPAAGFFLMAVVAASQTYYDLAAPLEITGYSLRNVSIKTALRIPEDDHGVEVILSMELVDTATAKTPAWASFSVSSVARGSNEWTEHCTGLVKVEASDPQERVKMESVQDPRIVDARAWYKKFASVGLGYGPTFQGLSEIRSGLGQDMAEAKVALKTTAGTITGESIYPLHPASLDSLFQLGLIACHGAKLGTATTAFVPIHLSQMYLNSCGNTEDWAVGRAIGELRGLRGAYAKLQLLSPSGDLVLDIDSLRCISYSESKSFANEQGKAFSSPFSRLVWKPDIRTLTNQQSRELFRLPPENVGRAHLFPGINKTATVILVDMYETLVNTENGPKPSGDLRHFLDWIKRRVEGDDTEGIREIRRLSQDERLQLLGDLYQETGHLVEVKIARLIHENMIDIFHERRTGVELMVEAGLLAELYQTGLFMTGAYPQLSNIFDALGHADPSLSVLELGAGTGGATRVVMKALVGPNGVKRYKEYTFTDITPGFLASAKDAMQDFDDVHFSVCDIEQDPLEQGYQPVYDVVMASQTLHATASISNTLENCRKLLKPGGKLVLVENTQNNFLVGIILGTLTGYWHGIPDGRTDSPFLSRSSWDAALKKTGFSGCEMVLDDYPEPYNTTTVLVSTLLDPDSSRVKPSPFEVQLLHGDKGPPALLSEVARALESRGIPSKVVSLETVTDALRSNIRGIAFIEDEYLFLDGDERPLKAFQHLAAHAESLVCLTSTGIAKGRSPDGAFIAGLLRTIGTENPAGRFISIDIDAEDFNIDDPDLVACIADQQLAIQSPSDRDSEDREFVWQDGCMWVSRFVPDAGIQEYSEAIKTPANIGATELRPLDSQGPVRAAFETPGILSSLYFKPYAELLQPLPRGWIEVKVAAVGLNWKDLGLSSGRFDGNNLSSEYAGIVSQTGADVTGLAVGDRVYGMGKGHFGNYTRVPAAFAQKLEPEVDLTEAATIPLVYMTAVYAFDHVTQLRKGQGVLIQSATGGLGLAAIQLAQAKGAIVFATAGTAEKARFLSNTMQIPAAHIFSSRDISDLSRAVAATDGGGFDVILSTAGGDMLYESIKALAPLGHLIDVGRMDVVNSKTMGLELFQKCASFSSFDLSLVLDRDPVIGGKLMETVSSWHRAGKIKPIRPFSATDISKLDQALLGFSKGTHIGKLVVTFQDPDSLVKMIPSAPAARFDPEASYVITGGLGGLGRSIISWIADRGAQNIWVLSRSGASSAEAQAVIKKLAARGVLVRTVACDVGKREQVLHAIQQASSDRPLKGIIHSAVSYQDLSFDKLSVERWRESLSAKVQGTKNLHEATVLLPLDFFVMTTSLESVFALATQSAYTAANTFQDAFARYRRRRGLPASTASFGLINDVGWTSTDSTTVDMFARNKTLTISEHQFLALLEPAFINNHERHASPAEQWTGQRHDPLSAANILTCLDPAALAAKKREEAEMGTPPPSAPPRWYSDGRVSLVMRAFDDAYRHAGGSAAGQGAAADQQGGKAAIVRLRREFDEAVGAVAAADNSKSPDERASALAFVVEAIVAAVADMLFIDASGVSPSRPVAALGVDSLIAAELRNWFHVALGTKISTLDLLDANTSISQLAVDVLDKALEKGHTDSVAVP